MPTKWPTNVLHGREVAKCLLAAEIWLHIHCII